MANEDFVIKKGELTRFSGFSRNIVIPDGVIKIGKLAFQLQGISSVVIPESVVEICDGAFNACEHLTSITTHCVGLSSFAPRHSVQARSALGLASVPFSHSKRKPKNKSFPFSAFRFPFFLYLCTKLELI